MAKCQNMKYSESTKVPSLAKKLALDLKQASDP